MRGLDEECSVGFARAAKCPAHRPRYSGGGTSSASSDPLNSLDGKGYSKTRGDALSDAVLWHVACCLGDGFISFRLIHARCITIRQG